MLNFGFQLWGNFYPEGKNGSEEAPDPHLPVQKARSCDWRWPQPYQTHLGGSRICEYSQNDDAYAEFILDLLCWSDGVVQMEGPTWLQRLTIRSHRLRPEEE